jgi:hypothetical protein
VHRTIIDARKSILRTQSREKMRRIRDRGKNKMQFRRVPRT